jgi:hypothetical protein
VTEDDRSSAAWKVDLFSAVGHDDTTLIPNHKTIDVVWGSNPFASPGFIFDSSSVCVIQIGPELNEKVARINWSYGGMQLDHRNEGIYSNGLIMTEFIILREGQPEIVEKTSSAACFFEDQTTYAEGFGPIGCVQGFSYMTLWTGDRLLLRARQTSQNHVEQRINLCQLSIETLHPR